MPRITIICDTQGVPEREAMACSFGAFFEGDGQPYTVDQWPKAESGEWYVTPRVSDSFYQACNEYNAGQYPQWFLNKGLTESQIDFARTFVKLVTDEDWRQALIDNGVTLQTGNPWD